MNIIAAVAVALLLTGCSYIGGYGYGPFSRGANPYAAVYGVPDAEIVTRPPQLYTRAEIDAINAEMACRTLARTPLQAGVCGVRR